LNFFFREPFQDREVLCDPFIHKFANTIVPFPSVKPFWPDWVPKGMVVNVLSRHRTRRTLGQSSGSNQTQTCE
jgi:hypothetical protein